MEKYGKRKMRLSTFALKRRNHLIPLGQYISWIYLQNRIITEVTHCYENYRSDK